MNGKAAISNIQHLQRAGYTVKEVNRIIGLMGGPKELMEFESPVILKFHKGKSVYLKTISP